MQHINKDKETGQVSALFSLRVNSKVAKINIPWRKGENLMLLSGV